MLHLAMVRSPVAHATITSIDTSGAGSMPNVLGRVDRPGADRFRGGPAECLADHG